MYWPTWAEIARVGNSTDQEAPATSPADAITLYKRYIAMGFQVRFLTKSNGGYEDITLFCRFPVSSVASNKPSQPPHSRRRQHRRNCPRNRGKPATCTTSAQTKPLASTSPSRLLCTASPPPLGQTSSPTAPPPEKKTRKRRCELELLRDDDNDHDQTMPISPPSSHPTPPPRSPSLSPSQL